MCKLGRALLVCSLTFFLADMGKAQHSLPADPQTAVQSTDIDSGENLEAFPISEPFVSDIKEPTSDEANTSPLQMIKPREQDAIRRFKKGFFQRWQLSGGWIAKRGNSDLGQSFWRTSVSVALPLGSFRNLLLITPSFQVDYLDGPTAIDVPPQLYATGVDFMWRGKLNDRWGAMVGVRPSVNSDFEADEDTIRVMGRALLTWECLPKNLTLIFGVVVLNRNDIPVLPGVGLIWTPDPDLRIDLVFPRPKIAYRIGFVPSKYEHWVYFSGSLGGRTWAERSTAA